MARVLLADDSQEVLVMLSSWLKLKDRHSVDICKPCHVAYHHQEVETKT